MKITNLTSHEIGFSLVSDRPLPDRPIRPGSIALSFEDIASYIAEKDSFIDRQAAAERFECNIGVDRKRLLLRAEQIRKES